MKTQLPGWRQLLAQEGTMNEAGILIQIAATRNEIADLQARLLIANDKLTGLHGELRQVHYDAIVRTARRHNTKGRKHAQKDGKRRTHQKV
jgi:hypothetical protein